MIKLTKKKWIFVIGLFCICVGGYGWYFRSNNTSDQVQYVTEVAQKGTLINSISASGSIIVEQDATVDPTITGTVANLSVKVGDKVEEGQTLFTIINDDLNVSVSKEAASYQQAVNAVESAKFEKKQAKADYDAAKKKDKADGSTYTSKQLEVFKKKIDVKEDAIVQAEKSMVAAAISYRNEQANAAKRTVTAPISGTVNAVNIKNGDDLSRVSSDNADAPIIIGDLTTLKAQVQVNEVDISNVSVGQKTTITFSAMEDLTLSGRVEQVDALGTSEQGVVTYNVTITFDSLDERLKPEMSVTAAIVTNVKQDVIIVPNGAVKSSGDTSSVEILAGGSTTPQKITVKTGLSNNTETEIISGVSAGDKVVTQTIDVSGSSSTSKSSSSSNSNNRSGGIMIPGMGGGPR